MRMIMKKEPSANRRSADGHQENGRRPQSSTAANTAVDPIISNDDQKKTGVTGRGRTVCIFLPMRMIPAEGDDSWRDIHCRKAA
jgi:hypothetical protein